MKKQLITCLAIAAGMAATETANAQWTTDGTAIRNTNSGGVGIGTATGQVWDKLTVNGNIGFSEVTGNYQSIIGRSVNNGMAIYSNYGWSGGAGIMLNSYSNGGGMSLVSGNTSANTTPAFNFINTPDGSTWNSLMYIKKDGNVGIGDVTPFDKLTVNGNIGFKEVTANYQSIIGRSVNNGMAIYSNYGWSGGAGLLLNSHSAGGNIQFVSCNPGNSNPAFTFINTPDGTTWNTLVKIEKNGGMVIGNVSANNNYKLFVEQGILTERLKIAGGTSVEWSDFVFADDYELRPLSEVEEYVKENKHLPEIPSAEEVQKDGLDIAQMDAKLLQKIEELTLYVIRQQKQIEELQKKSK